MEKIVRPWFVLLQHRRLVYALSKHAIVSKYRTSWMGLLWPLMLPVLLIGVFSFVFGYIMPLKWVSESEIDVSFSIFLFSGLVVFTFFSETVSRAPTLILENINLVKKVVFPLEVISVSNVCVASVFFFINLLVFAVFVSFNETGIGIIFILYLGFIFPFFLFLVGLSWFLSSLSVYVRDVVHVISIAVSALMFLSPVFYPIENAPDIVRMTHLINPIAILIESLRSLVFYGNVPSVEYWLMSWSMGLFVFYGGFFWFERTKKGFSDVI